MSLPRQKPSLKMMLAAMTREWGGIAYEHAKLLTEDQIISLVQWDHGIHHAIGGPHVHWNYTPRFIPAHREKTRKIDQPRIAKTKRGGKDEAEFRQRLLAKTSAAPTPETAKPKRAWPARKMPSRPFPKRKMASKRASP